MTITEFLLARIAEDERTFHVAATAPRRAGKTFARRVLAECAAKREAIEAAWGDHWRIEGEWGSSRSREELDRIGDVPDVVTALASVYADHPDYNPAWRM